MANEIKIDLSLTGEHAAARGMDNFGKATEKAGDKVTGLSKDAGQLNKKIAETDAEVKKLIKTFDETGDLDLLKSIRKEQSNLRLFERLGKSIAQEAQEAGEKAGVTLSKSLTNSLMASRGLIIPPLIAVAAMAAPVMGAAISSAVVGAAGTGGIVGGIVAAAQDQRVQEAAKQVGNRIGSALTDAGGPFVGPLIESLRLLDQAGDRLAANFEEAGKKIAPTLVPLTKGITGFVDETMPGFVRAMDSARPVIRAVGAELPKIGMALSDFMDKISDDPDQAVMGIVAISQAVQGAIDISGDLLNMLGNVFEWSSRTGASVSQTMETLFGWMPVVGTVIENQGAAFREQVAAIDAARDASKDYVGDGVHPIIRAQDELKTVTKTATEAIEDQIKAMDKMFGRLMDPQELASDYQAAIDNLTESVRENGRTFDINTEAGRENARAIRDTAEAIKEIRNNTIETTGDVEAANTAYYNQVEALRQQAIRLGMSKQEANNMAAALRDIPRQVDVEVRAPGLIDAINRAQYLNRLLGSISAGARARAGDTSGYGGGRAGGGPMMPGKWYTVGEDGVEVVQQHPGGGATVYNNKQTQSMMSGASGGSAMPTVIAPQFNISVAVERTGDRLTDLLMQALAHQLRFTGGLIGEYQIPPATT